MRKEYEKAETELKKWKEMWGGRLDQLLRGEKEKCEGEFDYLKKKEEELMKEKNNRWKLVEDLLRSLANFSKGEGNEQIA